MTLLQQLINECEADLKKEDEYWETTKKLLINKKYNLLKISGCYIVFSLYEQDGKKYFDVITGVWGKGANIDDAINNVKQIVIGLGYDIFLVYACKPALAKIYLNNGFHIVENKVLEWVNNGQ